MSGVNLEASTPARLPIAGIVVFEREHGEEGSGSVVRTYQDNPHEGIIAFDANEQAARQGTRWIDKNMARVLDPGDPLSPDYEDRRVAELSQYVNSKREAIGRAPLSLLVANLHTSPYLGNSALSTATGDPLMCALAAEMGFDKLVVTDFPNTLRFRQLGSAGVMDVMNVIVELSPDHPLFENPGGWRRVFGLIIREGVPLGKDEFGLYHFSGVTRYHHLRTVPETEARELRLPHDYKGFEQIGAAEAAALELPRGHNYYAWTWGDKFSDKGARGEIVWN